MTPAFLGFWFVISLLVGACTLTPGMEEEQGTLRFVTEDYPPLTFRNAAGEMTGLATEIVMEVMERQTIDEKIALLPWSEAYDMALKEPNVVIFSINRTPVREKLFHWVGPIAKSSTILYAKKGAGVTVNSLEDAKGLTAIGVVESWFSKQNLEQDGFTNLESAPLPIQIINRLMAGEVQAVPLTDITAAEILKEGGFNIRDVEPVFSIDTEYIFIGLSKGTPRSVVQAWEKDLQQMKTDGTFGKIYERYFPGEDTGDLMQ